MKSLTSWLIAMFMIMFWLFRVVVAFMTEYGKNFGGFIPFNQTIEIVLLFLTILCFILFLRRNILGGIIYLGAYGFYFGQYIIANLLSGNQMTFNVLQNVLVAAIGILIAVFVFFDLFISKVRKRDPKDKKTDWFFKNSQYDRNYDERADKNEYRNY